MCRATPGQLLICSHAESCSGRCWQRPLMATAERMMRTCLRLPGMSAESAPQELYLMRQTRTEVVRTTLNSTTTIPARFQAFPTAHDDHYCPAGALSSLVGVA